MFKTSEQVSPNSSPRLKAGDSLGRRVDRKGWEVWREWWSTQDAEEEKARAVLPKKRSTLDTLIDRACGTER